MPASSSPQTRKRLKRTSAFRAVSGRGRWVRGAQLSVGVLPGLPHQTRIGLRGTRAIRGAVGRNRLKRQLRAILFHDELPLRIGLDLIVVFHPKHQPVTTAALHRELEELCRRAGALRSQP